ncbi:putative nitrile hydratase regulator clustered with urea transport [Pseudonocardia sp. Ae168_Ps1]|nr:putative nitrile hydratase regulator clustered with urea transport [Pseudonocardia sp. Ae168_Ps1]OLL77488.1 putative nitrile hydratase regulator clustered with urea transport [Pseudonocardia sp. Ae150A_Ps1]OLL91578.1 putative nitrile hydratase regulator clustered with urea transport [Pseudonocardia sp. Ae356_Ps1]
MTPVTTTLDVAFVVPRSGPAGLFGPACEACGDLAAAELNEAGGVLGREVRLHPVDGGRAPAAVAAEVAGLLDAGVVGAVSGWHISAVRQALAPVVGGRVPYVYAPLYEGGERTPGIFLTGETPENQVLPGLRWMAAELGVRTWCVVGNDYVWPRGSARVVRRWARGTPDVRVLDETFLPLGTDDFGPAVERVRRSGAQGVLMFLVGSDAVGFNRAFAAAGADRGRVRFSPLMEENMLLATGAEATRELYAAAGWFETLATASALEFSGRYAARFGVRAPVPGALAESCFEAVTLLGALAGRARSTDPAALLAVAESTGFDGPRGAVSLHDGHLRQDVYLARADGLSFDVLDRLA